MDYPPNHKISENIIAQAKAGSIAAIIQLLNESLAHLRVRTRAVLEKRSLLLLCEADNEEALEPKVIIPHVRQVLEAIAPNKIRRIHFFSRLTREQQLLWTTEIARSTEVLWSEEITLKRPSLLQQIQEQFKSKGQSVNPTVRDLPRRLTSPSHARPVWPVISVLGVLGVLLLGSVTIAARRLWFVTASPPVPTLAPANPPDQEAPPIDPSTSSSSNPTDSTADPGASDEDPFVVAVRLAEQAALDGKNATTRTDWLDLAFRWQQASDLMAAVAVEDDRYKTAQDRVVAYRKNSEAALAQANQL
ncbi:MAG: hypothetical protein ACO3NK_18545 [Prochlorotrichaceae cyanobacterium]|jgi:hypothetical protein